MPVQKYLFFLIISLFVLSGLNAYAEEKIFITITSKHTQPIIDGTGSYKNEWKDSSEDIFMYGDGARLALRSVHDRDNIYILLDLVTDTIENRYKDQAIVCFDSKDDGGDRPDANDYCFVAAFGSSSFITYRGGGQFAVNSNLDRIGNPEGVEAKAGVSNQFDLYTHVPHMFYEFKVPVELLGRSNTYGLYTAVFDGNTNALYNWPSINKENYPYIIAPKQWGKLVSPDNSLPEFPSTSVAVLAAIVLFTTLSTRIKTII